MNVAESGVPCLHSLCPYPVGLISEDYQKALVRNGQSMLSLIEMVPTSVNGELLQLLAVF